MSYIPTKGHKKVLKANYEDSCNGYLLTLLNMWDLSIKDGFWVSDEVGGIYVHESDISLSMSDIIFCVENDVPMSTFFKYTDYCAKCAEYGFNVPNLSSYNNGCQLVPQETFDKLDAMKEELNKCINDTKSKF